MGFRITIFIISILIWIMLTFSIEIHDLAVGFAASALCAFYFGKISGCRVNKAVQIHRYLWFLYFVPVFVYYCIKANIFMAYRVLNPKLPIRPGIVKIKTTLNSGIAKAFLANAITLTPGTMTVDMIGEDLYIHWIYVSTADQSEKKSVICEKFEYILRRIFE
jgi:multicomponent Na+:H+ antiporter subunit E